MRRLVVNLDNTLDVWLSGQVNQNETVRKALYLYKGDITTDTIQGLRKSYSAIIDKLEEHDAAFGRMDKLISVLETRM